jgi:heme-degrading monooxygenase HmoA
MIGIHVEFQMQPGQGERLLEWKRREGELRRRAPGFLKRTLLRSREDPDRFFYQSCWRSHEAVLAFLHSPQFEAAITASAVRPAIAQRTVTRIHEVFDETGAPAP